MIRLFFGTAVVCGAGFVVANKSKQRGVSLAKMDFKEISMINARENKPIKTQDLDGFKQIINKDTSWISTVIPLMVILPETGLPILVISAMQNFVQHYELKGYNEESERVTEAISMHK